MATQAQLPPGYASEDRGPGFRGYCIFLTILTIVSIILRLWSRGLNPAQADRRRFWWDDWAAVVSVPFILAQMILALKLVDLGVGRHIAVVPPANVEPILKALLATYLVYGFALTITKTSALLFLHRIFPSHGSVTWFKYALWTAHAINTAWLVAYALVEVFQCQPIAKFWNPALSGNCVLQSKIYIGAAAPSVAIDLLILILPLPLLWGLNTSRARKIGIIVVFILGYCVVVVSIGRLVVALTSLTKLNEDLTYAGVKSFYWGVSEAPITLFSVCLPAMLALGRRLQSNYLSPLASKISLVLESRRRASGSQHERMDDAQYPDRNQKPGRRVYETIGLSTVDSTESGCQRWMLKEPNRSQVRYTAKIGAGNDGQLDASCFPQKSIRVDNGVTVCHS